MLSDIKQYYYEKKLRQAEEAKQRKEANAKNPKSRSMISSSIKKFSQLARMQAPVIQKQIETKKSVKAVRDFVAEDNKPDVSPSFVDLSIDTEHQQVQQ